MIRRESDSPSPQPREQRGRQIAHGDFLFSRDLFDPARPKFGYWCFNNGFGVADAGGTTIFDCTSARVISPDSTAAQLRDGKAMLQTTYKAIREL